MKYLRHAYSKKCFVVCLKFKLNWVCCFYLATYLLWHFCMLIANTFYLFSTPHEQNKSHLCLLKIVQDLGRTWTLERNHRKEHCVVGLSVKQLLKSENKDVSLLCLRIYMKIPSFFSDFSRFKLYCCNTILLVLVEIDAKWKK